MVKIAQQCSVLSATELYTEKIVKMAKFMLYIFYHNLKKYARA